MALRVGFTDFKDVLDLKFEFFEVFDHQVTDKDTLDDGDVRTYQIRKLSFREIFVIQIFNLSNEFNYS